MEACQWVNQARSIGAGDFKDYTFQRGAGDTVDFTNGEACLFKEKP